MNKIFDERMKLIKEKYGECGENFYYNAVASGDAVNVSFGRVSEYWIFEEGTAKLKDIWID